LISYQRSFFPTLWYLFDSGRAGDSRHVGVCGLSFAFSMFFPCLSFFPHFPSFLIFLVPSPCGLSVILPYLFCRFFRPACRDFLRPSSPFSPDFPLHELFLVSLFRLTGRRAASVVVTLLFFFDGALLTTNLPAVFFFPHPYKTIFHSASRLLPDIWSIAFELCGFVKPPPPFFLWR